jgi:hypothetical protein
MNKIDNHFSKKLKDFEVKPSDRANELFMKKIAAPSKAGNAYWKHFALAASVMLALGILFALNLSLPSSDTALELNNESETVTIAEDKLAAEIKMSEVESEERISENIVSNNPPQVIFASVKHVTSIEDETIVQETISVETVRRNLGTLNKISPEKVHIAQVNNLVDYTLIDVGMDKLDTDFETNFIAPTQEIQLKEKPLLAKVFNEVKYIIHGEKIDLERAGIKPAATVLAHNPTGFIASEKQQFRENVYKIKEFLR